MTAETDLLKQMATPSRLGVTIGPEFMGTPYVPYPWLRYVERRVLDAINDTAQRFIILNVPSQNGKTTYSGMLLPAWYLGMFPNRQVIFITHSAEYSEGWGVKTRNLLNRYGQRFFGVGVSNDQSSAGNWKTSQGFGGMIAVGIGGGIVGNPGHLIIVDDILKTIEEAASPTTKKKHVEEYDGTISTRFQEYKPEVPGSTGTTVLITATRFADDDLSGTLIERMKREGYEGDHYEVINIPALAEPPDELELEGDELEEWRDFLGRRAGEGLKGQFSREFYVKKKATIEPAQWSSIYQGNPGSSEDGMFPKANWRYWSRKDPPRIVRKARGWDLAATAGGGDWTVGSLFGLGENGDLYLLDRERFQWASADVERAVDATAKRDGYEVVILIEQEKAGAGKSLIEHYQRLLAGYTVKPVKTDGGKEVRARPYSAMQQNKRVWLPVDEPRLCEEWIKEHSRMMGDGRRPRHDDQIDTGAYCCLELIGLGATSLWIPGEDQDDPRLALLQAGQMGRFQGQSIPARVSALL